MQARRPPRRQQRAAASEETVIIVDRDYALQMVRSLTMQLAAWRRVLELPEADECHALDTGGESG